MIFEKICVLGLGYIGLPTASTFATHGLKVTGVDVNPAVVAGLKNGQLHLYEPGLRTLVQAALRSGNLQISDQVQPADAFLISVPTPFYDDKKADMRFVQSAAEMITPNLRPGNLVILESTSPPLTTIHMVAPILEQSGLKAGEDFYLAYSPERVLPGQILRELIENARVIGGINPDSAEAGRDLYQIFVRGEIILTDATTAEMVKLMENTYRDINIAVANEFARMSERFGVDVWEAIQLANRHPRVNILNPGPGVGGHCISVDPWFLVESAPDLAQVIRSARQVNDQQPHFVLNLIQKAFNGNLQGQKITALGLAYKPDVDDLRESPAIEVVQLLLRGGAEVTVFEPYKTDYQIPGALSAQSLDDAIEKTDALVLLVGHTSFKAINPAEIKLKLNRLVAFDCVNGWNKEEWRAAGFELHRLGAGNLE